MYLLGALACVVLAGCLGSDESAERMDQNASASKCPNGEEPLSTVFDLGTSPGGRPTARAAVARFLNQRNAILGVDSFERVGKPASASKATFVFIEGDFELARLYLERLDQGWLVVAYARCKGELFRWAPKT